MNTPNGSERLIAIAKRLKEEEIVESLTVREFLSWFGAKRRGVWVVLEMQAALIDVSLTTEPDFESSYIDGAINFVLMSPETEESNATPTKAVMSAATLIGDFATFGTVSVIPELPDPTHKISKLAAANNAPITVCPDASLGEAITLMLARGFSQLPVMTSPREVKGIITWQSIGARLGTGSTGTRVIDMADRLHYEVKHDVSIFQAIPLIVAHDYVLVRGPTNLITGIVTASDLSLQFLQLSEPFLLLSEIENQVRQLLGKRFELGDLLTVRDPTDGHRKIEGVSDLNFGEYIRLLENPENWKKSGLPLDRAVFCKQLDAVRIIRNDVMHFDPDGISPQDVETLREFARFLQRMGAMGIA